MDSSPVFLVSLGSGERLRFSSTNDDTVIDGLNPSCRKLHIVVSMHNRIRLS